MLVSNEDAGGLSEMNEVIAYMVWTICLAWNRWTGKRRYLERVYARYLVMSSRRMIRDPRQGRLMWWESALARVTVDSTWT